MGIRVGCAGWSIPRVHAARFPAEGSHLARYAARFSAVEIDSSFYHEHRPSTYARWAETVPQDFRFAVKLPRQVTHVARLAEFQALAGFFTAIRELGEKLGPLLVQLPPSLAYDDRVARGFFAALRDRFSGQVVCEPRHASWFSRGVGQILAEFKVARVAADPAAVPAGSEPGGWNGLVYYRLHGSPHKYNSAYSAAYLDALVARLTAVAGVVPAWCIFDNTAQGAATLNGLDLLQRLRATKGE